MTTEDTGNINDDRDTQREITDLNTGTQITTGTAGHREYKWRPGHSKRNYRLGHRDTNDDQDTGKINDDRDTGTQLQRGRRGEQGGYINDDGDTGNVRLAITINKAQRAIIRIMRYRSEYRLFFPWTIIMLHVQESVNLIIYLYGQTMGQQRMLYIRKFYVVKNIYRYIYLYSQVGHRDTTTMARN